jgi:glycerol-3-phosphate acyltransferase PlsX
MTIYVDAMGGDYAPTEIIKGASLAVETFGCALTLIGREEVIRNVAEKENLSLKQLAILDAREEIAMDEEPASAVKRKKDSSIVVGAMHAKTDPNSVFVSAGSTGAVLSAALLYTGRIKGIQRPALGTVLPGKTPTLLIDNGANAECKPEYLVQFALMGTAYMQAVLGIENPRVALVNIGAEEVKGNALYKETFPKLKAANINFIGNLEPKEFLNGYADVLVCDGFTGNIV